MTPGDTEAMKYMSRMASLDILMPTGEGKALAVKLKDERAELKKQRK